MQLPSQGAFPQPHERVLDLSTLHILPPAPSGRPSKPGQGPPDPVLTRLSRVPTKEKPQEGRATISFCSTNTGYTNGQMTGGRKERGRLQDLPDLTGKGDSPYSSHQLLGPPARHCWVSLSMPQEPGLRLLSAHLSVSVGTHPWHPEPQQLHPQPHTGHPAARPHVGWQSVRTQEEQGNCNSLGRPKCGRL